MNPKLAQVLAKEAGIGTLNLYDGANVTKRSAPKENDFPGVDGEELGKSTPGAGM